MCTEKLYLGSCKRGPYAHFAQIYASFLVALATSASAGFVPVAGYQAVPEYTKVYAAPTAYVAAPAPALSTTVHHTPAVSKATRVTSYRTTHPVVPQTVAKVSTYTPAVHTVHASVPSTVSGVVHGVPAYGYGYYPTRYTYGHPYGYHPLGYGYAHGLMPYGLNYGYGLNGVSYVTPVKKCTYERSFYLLKF
ncbi:cuticle protein 65-like [Rhipicephalus sanguineus]|uniref:cuticle protein 65-like n=1 Tax=Rhipicephalus sanguineus TaxID=34632 RepID=UPI001893F6CA|nr:cuticle protein 65-like [Rhipicephalus sanguineus]